MVDFVRYGSQDHIPFKITLNGVGVSGLTFAADDIQVSIDNAAWINIGTEVAERVGSGLGKGWYNWTPSVASRTQAAIDIVVNIADVSGAAFDENGVVGYTGGNVAARFDGT